MENSEKLFTEAELDGTIGDTVATKFRERGRANILIAGKTGVGKSTLINAVFNGRFAATGQGMSVTHNTFEYVKPGIPLHIFDTMGLELADYALTISKLKQLVSERAHSTDANEHIHCAWLCIQEGGRRVEDAEKQIVEMLAEQRIPVVVVITKAMHDNGFRNIVRQEFPKAKNVVRVMAEETMLDSGHILPVSGKELIDLVNLTMDIVPEAQKNAFAAAQKVSMDLKMQRSRIVYGSSATLATAIAVAPIPFSAAAALVPIHIGMLSGITAVFGLPLSTAFIASLVSSTIVGVAGTIGGRALVGALLLLIPGAGIALNGMINGGTAAILTTAFGEAYVQTLAFLLTQNPNEIPTVSQIAERLKIEMAKRNPFVSAPPDFSNTPQKPN